MFTLPDAIVPILQPFSTMFQQRTWTKAQVLLIGAILSPRKRTITSALRVMGLSDDSGFSKYHHVLNRAEWFPPSTEPASATARGPVSRTVR